MEKNGLPIIAFASGSEFAAWLQLHHADTPGVWVRMYKKHTGKPSVAWEEAVEAALCYGWIDSVANKLDDESYIQRFTPRRPRSVWSKKNCATAERLIAEGTMHAAGLRAVERAKADGRWDKAYDSPKDMQVPQFDDTSFNKSLLQVATILNENRLKWCLGASGALYVHGVPVKPKDLDIVVDIGDFQAARDAFKELAPGPAESFEFAGKPFQKFALQTTSYSAEVAGFDIGSDPLISVRWQNTDVPVHSLEFELEMYRQRPGKEQIAQLIEATIERKA
jgi:uncharacterized protein YdeI (YjbR/CyaY-like superfamily)